MDKKTIETIMAMRRDIMRCKEAIEREACAMNGWGVNHNICEIMRIEEDIKAMGGCPETTGGPISWAEVDDDIYYDMFG